MTESTEQSLLIEQRTDAWFELRKGKITSSEIHKIMGTGKGSEVLTDTAKTYLLSKVIEHFDGFAERAVGSALDWGTEMEPAAIEFYEKKFNVVVDKASFVPFNNVYGGSPDGLVGKEGIIEVKCPFTSVNHFKHGLIDSDAAFKKVKPEYYYQCISNMICTNTTWCDFVSFDPRVKSEFVMFNYRLHLTEEEKAAMLDKVAVASAYMEELKNKLLTLNK